MSSVPRKLTHANQVLGFGKYKDKDVAWVMTNDPSYLAWWRSARLDNGDAPETIMCRELHEMVNDVVATGGRRTRGFSTVDISKLPEPAPTILVEKIISRAKASDEAIAIAPILGSITPTLSSAMEEILDEIGVTTTAMDFRKLKESRGAQAPSVNAEDSLRAERAEKYGADWGAF